MTKEQAIAEFKAVIKAYQWRCKRDDPDNKAMLKMFAADRKEMRHVLSLYRKGRYGEARAAAQHMDTSPREYIPQKVWDDINS